jgi:hypothetical protein
MRDVPQALGERLKHVAPQNIAGEFARPDDLHQPRYFELFHVVGERRRVDAHAIAHRAAGERVRAFAEKVAIISVTPKLTDPGAPKRRYVMVDRRVFALPCCWPDEEGPS